MKKFIRTSQFVFSEILSYGRIAYGEEFRYHRFQNKICIFDDSKDMEGGATRTSAGHTVVRILGRNAQKLTEVTGQILESV